MAAEIRELPLSSVAHVPWPGLPGSTPMDRSEAKGRTKGDWLQAVSRGHPSPFVLPRNAAQLKTGLDGLEMKNGVAEINSLGACVTTVARRLQNFGRTAQRSERLRGSQEPRSRDREIPFSCSRLSSAMNRTASWNAAWGVAGQHHWPRNGG